MAARLACQNSRVVTYLPSFRSVVRHFRAFSSYDESQPKGDFTQIVTEEAKSDLPDPQLGQMEPHNNQFPMPGMVGPIPQKQHITFKPPTLTEPDLLTNELPADRHLSVLQQFARIIQEQEDEGEAVGSIVNSPLAVLECVVQACPQLIRKDFQDLFPERDLSVGQLTVITLSQHTVNDMSGWSQEVEEEREELLANFIEGAEEICEILKEAGYWADFIDPSCGRPYLGAYTNATLYETDERYRHFGMEIKDLGCCKVISHRIWGTHVYVGSLFTNAPYDHPILKKMAHNKKPQVD